MLGRIWNYLPENIIFIKNDGTFKNIKKLLLWNMEHISSMTRMNFSRVNMQIDVYIYIYNEQCSLKVFEYSAKKQRCIPQLKKINYLWIEYGERGVCLILFILRGASLARLVFLASWWIINVRAWDISNYTPLPAGGATPPPGQSRALVAPHKYTPLCTKFIWNALSRKAKPPREALPTIVNSFFYPRTHAKCDSRINMTNKKVLNLHHSGKCQLNYKDHTNIKMLMSLHAGERLNQYDVVELR